MVLQVFRECSTHLYQSYPCIQTQTIHVHLSSTMFIPEVQLAICLELVTTKYPRTITIPPKLIGLHNTVFWGINNFPKSSVCAFHFLKQRENEFQHYTYSSPRLEVSNIISCGSHWQHFIWLTSKMNELTTQFRKNIKIVIIGFLVNYLINHDEFM